MDKSICLRCEHEWLARIKKPLSCPSCKCRNWDTEGYVKCEVCNRNFLNIATHHKDGQRKNNKKDNLIKLCVDCHSMVHRGLRKIDRRFDDSTVMRSRIRKYKNQEQVIKRLSELNSFWLKQKGGTT